MRPADYRCPGCGFDGLYEPARSPATGNGSYEICRSCRFEFGVTDDDRGISDDEWRAEWIADGMPWRGRSDPPHGWDPADQLGRLGGGTRG